MAIATHADEEHNDKTEIATSYDKARPHDDGSDAVPRTPPLQRYDGRAGQTSTRFVLRAAEQHGLRPQRCLVIEDSLSGVVAAHPAGMAVIGFVGGSHIRPGHADAMRDGGCVEVFARMDDVGRFLGS